jgi:hypothetical protein
MNNTIVIILPRGEAIRNFVYSGTLDLVSQSAAIQILSIDPSNEILKLLESRYERVQRLDEIPEKWIVRITRDILDIAHGRFIWSEAAKERWRLRDSEARTVEQKIKRFGKKLLCFPFSNRNGLGFLSKMERKLSRILLNTESYLESFNKLKPSLVFNGSHVHSRNAIQAIQAAQWLKISTATFIFSWDNLTSQGRIIPPYDYYLVWNDALKDQLLNIYSSIKPEQVFVTGTPQFDFHFRTEFYWSKENFCNQVGADPNRPIVLYSTGMANHMPGEQDIVEEIADILKEMKELGSPQLLVRVYAKDLTGRFDELKKRRPDILFPEVPWEPAWLTPKIEDTYLLTNTLRHVDIGINVASTISLELCMFDKPVINVGYNPRGVSKTEVDYSRYYKFDHYRPVVESKAVQVAYSQKEIKNLIRDAFSHPERYSSQRKEFIKHMFGYFLDGRSANRISKTLIELSKNGIHSD